MLTTARSRSGTNGLAGAADSVLILRREPNSADATLYLRGRDVEEAQFPLTYDRSGGMECCG